MLKSTTQKKVKNGDWQGAQTGRVNSVEGWDVEFYDFLAQHQMKSFGNWCELELKRYPLETRKANNLLDVSVLPYGLLWRTE